MLKGNPADDEKVYIALAQMYSRVQDWNNAEENINKAIEIVDQAGRQGLRDLRRRLHLRAAEEV